MPVDLSTFFAGAYDDATPGLGAIVNRAGRIVYEQAIGLANLEHAVPIAGDTVFNLGSLAKQFTGLAILQLYAAGRLAPDTPAVRHLPELAHYAGAVTIAQLAHHASGLVDYNDLLWQKARGNSLHSTNDEVLQLLSRETALRFSPGSRWEYSNSNYVLLALIIERCTGQSLRAYLQQHVFAVAGMAGATVFDEQQPIVPHRAYGYERAGGGWKCWYVDTLATGCANVCASLHDLARWDDALYGDALAPPDVRRLLYEPGLDTAGRPLSGFGGGYSYGWMLQERCGARTMWHTGGDAGFRSLIVRFYEHELTVALLCNAADLQWPAAYALVERLYCAFGGRAPSADRPRGRSATACGDAP